MVFGGGFWVQLGLHGLVAGTALLAGIGIGLDGALRAGADGVLLGLAGFGLVAGSGASILARRGRLRGMRSGSATDGADEAKAQAPVGRDALTGLLNRAVFVEHLQRVLEGARRSDRKVALLCVDIADFRSINETLGHAAGDLLLRHVGARLSSVVRETDVVARLAADEFAILQCEPGGAAAAASLCERLLGAIEEPFDLHGQQSFVAARIGVTLQPDDGRDPFELLGNAALALGRAKEEGARTYRFFDADVDAEVRHRRVLERDLAQALERGELELHFQPRVDVTTRRPIGVEAVLHWHHPVYGRIDPEVFLPLAEDSGAIVAIGAWMLEQACAHGVRWHEAGATALSVSVDLSPVQFRHGDLAGLVGEVLERTGFAPGCLGLGITNPVLADDGGTNLPTLERLRAGGVRITLHDFGVGTSSIARLQRLPFDEVALDRSLVRRVNDDRNAAAVVRATLALGRDLGVPTVAEGVTTAAQLDFLVTEGCDLAQGDYFGAPVPVQEVDSLMREATAIPARLLEGEAQKIA